MGCCAGSPKQDGGESSKSRNPLYSRRNVCCTDIFILLLFVSFWGLMVYVAVYSIMRGDYKRMLFGYDSYGNTCNDESNTPIPNLTHSGKNTHGKGFVFFMDTWDPLRSLQICVSKCPDRDLISNEDVRKFFLRTNSSLCRYDIDLSKEIPSDAEFSRTGPCPKTPIFHSSDKLSMLVSRCVPDPFGLFGNETRNNFTSKFVIMELNGLLRKVISDIYLCWRELIALCLIAIAIASLMVILIRFLASIVVWLIVILAAVGSLVGSAFLWWTYYQERNNTEYYHIPVLSIDIQHETAFLIFSIVATVLTVILLLILLIMRKRIALVVALFHEAGKCLAAMPLLLIQPIWTFFFLFIFFLYWVAIQAHIATLGTPTAVGTSDFMHVQYIPEALAKHFWWIHLIGLIWTSEFILACQQFVIAGSVARWYFSVDKNRLGCPICKSVCYLILHHIGSVAFGSLIITMIKIPRYILMYIQSKCEGSQNACAQCCLKCCICCLYCLEKLLKFINQNAYTIIAIDGSNFCSAAQKAFGILTSNVLRVAAINSVGAFVLFLGKVGVMASTCAVSIVWLKSIPNLQYFAIPVFFITMFSFLIAHCFLSIYEMVVDALLLCFCEDCQMNDGSPGKEYYMNSSLMVWPLSSFLTVLEMRQEKYALEFVKNSSSRIEQLNRSQAAAQRKAGKQEGSSSEMQPMAGRKV